ncbi:MAG TPA: antibiotic biosynthesis monooxygenase [Thiothrix sp.]|nr:antibiotic biosynthesis monooxygenase [Thiothrix sp.]
MYVTLVHVYVKTDCIDDFIVASEKNHQQSIQEFGNCRFDILQDAADCSHFMLYEAYTHADTAAAHKQTAHYLTWRDTVAHMMAKPREGITFNGLFPSC